MCPIQLQLLSVSELWSLIVFLWLSCITYFLEYAINHSEFSQDDVSCTRMSVPPL